MHRAFVEAVDKVYLNNVCQEPATMTSGLFTDLTPGTRSAASNHRFAAQGEGGFTGACRSTSTIRYDALFS